MSPRPTPNGVERAALSIIPKPVSLEIGDGAFTLTPASVVLYGTGAKPEAEYLAESLAPATGLRLSVAALAPAAAPRDNSLVLELDPALARLGDEGYRLVVEKNRVRATAARPAGLFYAVQTFRQLLPVEILKDAPVAGVAWAAPCVVVEDQPRFGWRGQLFDCCRHFFDVDTVKRAIDLLALHKMNRLHWHITEDQGWRIEIKRYPKLTEVGAWRIDKDAGDRYGGYYTQEEVRDIVAYAARRHIVVVPEIEMPGHASAALASYPELGCTGGPYRVENGWGIFKDVYCAGDDAVFAFQKNVLDEVLQMFPSQYIHIGGDECPKDRWKECPKCQARIRAEGLKDEYELQSYFIKRIDNYLTERGRRLVGWDEILEGGLAPGAVVQSWRGVKGGVQAARQGHDVIMSPTSHCYLDYSYLTTSLEQSYSYEPVPEELTPEEAKHVLGLEGNMWTEWVPTRDRLDYQVYPRLTALAEVGWSPKEARDWEDFQSRMVGHYERFHVLGVKYGYDEAKIALEKAKPLGRWTPEQMKAEGVELVWEATEFIDGAGTYEVFFVYTEGGNALEIFWAALLEDGVEIARDTHRGWSGGDKRNIGYRLDLAAPKPDARYVVKAHVAPHGGTRTAGDVRIWKSDE